MIAKGYSNQNFKPSCIPILAPLLFIIVIFSLFGYIAAGPVVNVCDTMLHSVSDIGDCANYQEDGEIKRKCYVTKTTTLTLARPGQKSCLHITNGNETNVMEIEVHDIGTHFLPTTQWYAHSSRAYPDISCKCGTTIPQCPETQNYHHNSPWAKFNGPPISYVRKGFSHTRDCSGVASYCANVAFDFDATFYMSEFHGHDFHSLISITYKNKTEVLRWDGHPTTIPTLGSSFLLTGLKVPVVSDQFAVVVNTKTQQRKVMSYDEYNKFGQFDEHRFGLIHWRYWEHNTESGPSNGIDRVFNEELISARTHVNMHNCALNTGSIDITVANDSANFYNAKGPTSFFGQPLRTYFAKLPSWSHWNALSSASPRELVPGHSVSRIKCAVRETFRHNGWNHYNLWVTWDGMPMYSQDGVLWHEFCSGPFYSMTLERIDGTSIKVCGNEHDQGELSAYPIGQSFYHSEFIADADGATKAFNLAIPDGNVTMHVYGQRGGMPWTSMHFQNMHEKDAAWIWGGHEFKMTVKTVATEIYAHSEMACPKLYGSHIDKDGRSLVLTLRSDCLAGYVDVYFASIVAKTTRLEITTEIQDYSIPLLFGHGSDMVQFSIVGQNSESGSLSFDDTTHRVKSMTQRYHIANHKAANGFAEHIIGLDFVLRWPVIGPFLMQISSPLKDHFYLLVGILIPSIIFSVVFLMLPFKHWRTVVSYLIPALTIYKFVRFIFTTFSPCVLGMCCSVVKRRKRKTK